jgi:hypothetical protein
MSDAPHDNDTIVADRLAAISERLDGAPAPDPSERDRLYREWFDLAAEHPHVVEIEMGRDLACISQMTGVDAADMKATIKTAIEDMDRSE